jgi:hypothetical protein
LIEAPNISVIGTLAVNGGGGGGGGGGSGGAAGSLDRNQASGNNNGGSGGAGGTLNGGSGSQNSSGGGGGIGRIRFNTRAGTASVDNTKLSPSLNDSPTTCTVGPANVQ